MFEVIQHLQSEGYNVNEFIPDESVHRFKVDSGDHKKSGWYTGYQKYKRNGEMFHLVVYGDWRKAESPKVFSTINGKLSWEDKKFIREQTERAKKKSEEERKKSQEETSEKINQKWNELSLEGKHEYLEKKKISDISNQILGIKFDTFKNSLFIPFRDIEGKLWSYQEINWKCEKINAPGGKKSGNFHIIGELGDKIYFCEGFSTGASIYKAVKSGVVVCIDADNLEKVVSEFRRKYPDKDFIICGDDDGKSDGVNKGREVAESVAKKNFCTVVFPEFKARDNNFSDFNDLHCSEGIERVSEQLNLKEDDLEESLFLNCLGFNGEFYYFLSNYNKQVLGFNSLNENNLLKLMPLEYWEIEFPGQKSRVDWLAARNAMIRKSHKDKGGQKFKLQSIRGSGVWMDSGRIVVNMGNHLIVDGKKTPLHKIKSKYVYTLGSSLNELSDRPLTVEECNLLVNTCTAFKWIKPEYGILLAGWLVISRLCGALPVRPHMWITGGSETGKTTLLEKLVKVMMGENSLYVQGGTTEAGIRQSLGADAVPVMFDEFETNGRGSDENVKNLIELMRASWSDSHAVIIKGSSAGQATQFQVRFSALVSSIRIVLTNDADKGRFAVIELLPHGSDAFHWSHLSSLLDRIDGEYAERLFSRTISKSRVLLENFKVMKKSFAKKAGSRFGDQYGMLLAGYCLLIYDDIIKDEEADYLVSQINLDDEKEEIKDRDHDDALNHLLTTKIPYEGIGGIRTEDSIINLIVKTISSGGSSNAANQALLNLGIKAESGFVSVVQANHSELEKNVWRNTKWSNIWGKSLSRVSGATKNQSVWFRGIGNKKCVKIPFQIPVESPEKS